MEAEGRPSKVRKVVHNDDTLPQNSAAPLQHDGQEEHAKEQQEVQYALNDLDKAYALPDQVPADTLDASNTIIKADRGTDSEYNGAKAQLDTDEKPLSKNAQKRLRKKQEWEAKRDERKEFRKGKLLEKRERKKAAKAAAIAEGQPEPEPREYIARKQLPITIIIDCDFDELMHDGERISLGSQVTRSYSDNKNARFRAHLTISSFGGHMRDRFDGLLEGMYKQWRGVRFFETDFVDVSHQAKSWMIGPEGGVLEGAFSQYANSDEDNREALESQGEVVYLSSEADDTLEELKPYSTYIIGGLIDKNREKGLCHRRATQRGVRTARLPIGEYLNMSSRRVLVTSHVNMIMLKWLEHRDWGKAFISVIPQRKGGTLKTGFVQEPAVNTQGRTDPEAEAEAEAEAEDNKNAVSTDAQAALH